MPLLRRALFPYAGLLFLAILLACSSSRPLTEDAATAEGIARASVDRPAKITLSDSRSVQGYRVALRSDSTEWFSKKGIRSSVPTRSVREIDVASSHAWSYGGMGAFIGLCSGAMVGVMATLGSTFSIFPSDRSSTSNQGNNILIGSAIAGTVVGGISGLLIGRNLRTDYVRDSAR